MKRLFSLFVLFSLLYSASGGQAGVSFLLDDLPKSVRAMGMGNLLATPGSGAGNYGPSSVPAKERLSFLSLRAGLPFGDQAFCLGAGGDYGKRFGARLLWSQVMSRGIEHTEIDSITSADTLAYRVLGTMNSYENIFSALLGASPVPGLTAGAAVKYYYNRQGDVTGRGIGVDGGLAFRRLPAHLGVGVLVRNLAAPHIRYNRGLGSETPASSLNIGLSWDAFPGRAGFCVEAEKVLEAACDPSFSLGLEVKPVSVVFLRAGYGGFNSGQDGTICLGAGFDVKGIYLDYAYNGRFDRNVSGGHSLGLGYRMEIEE
jgi:hypothetical protein